MPMDPLVGHDPEFRLRATLTLPHQAGPSGKFAMKTGRHASKRYVSEPLYPRGGPDSAIRRIWWGRPRRSAQKPFWRLIIWILIANKLQLAKWVV
jgi:hypothetical protein